jgi:hypothetical protein
MNQHENDPVAESTETELVETGVDNPDVDPDDPDVDHLTRADVEADPGEATRKLPKNDQAL